MPEMKMDGKDWGGGKRKERGSKLFARKGAGQTAEGMGVRTEGTVERAEG